MRIPESIRILITSVRSFRFRRPETFDVTIAIAVGIALCAGIGLVIWLVNGPTLIVNNGGRPDLEAARGPLAGLPCPDTTLRPIAVMLASDPEARPLSGLRSAEMVFEAPVTPNGITRMMAVYQCMEPDEVGSIRSARATFVPFVQGLDAIYAHWGGERDILASLDAGIVDNVDALVYEGSVYYRKPGIPRPHNGFTTLEALRDQAEELGYPATASLNPYAHSADTHAVRNLGSIADTITIPGPPEMGVEFRYDSGTHAYRRWRGGLPEVDAENNLQVAPSVIIIMDVQAERTYDQYVDLETVGEGDATVYQGGRSLSARWHKSTPEASLRFTDIGGGAIAFTPGQIWVILQTP